MNVFEKKPSLLNVALVAGFTVVIFVCYYSSVISNGKIKGHPVYCYETLSGPVNSTLYITSLSDSADYLHYYRELQAGKNPVGNFPLNGLDPDAPVYVQGYVGKNATLAEVVSYEETHSKARPYGVSCYVYSPTLHVKPPTYQR